MEFKNKIAVVTGGHGGTGLNLVKKLIALKTKVYSLDSKFNKIKNKGNLVTYQIDLSSFEEIKKFSSFISKKERKLDFLINNAGVSLKLDKKNLYSYWTNTINTNLSSAFFLSNFLLNLLKKSLYPSIVNIASISSQVAMSNNQAYNCSKAGITSLTYSQAMDYKKFGIRSNCISPGYIKTSMTRKSYSNKKMFNERVNRMMLKNYGESSDVSEMVLYLCTKKSKYINAENIVVDGGLTKKGI